MSNYAGNDTQWHWNPNEMHAYTRGSHGTCSIGRRGQQGDGQIQPSLGSARRRTPTQNEAQSAGRYSPGPTSTPERRPLFVCAAPSTLGIAVMMISMIHVDGSRAQGQPRKVSMEKDRGAQHGASAAQDKSLAGGLETGDRPCPDPVNHYAAASQTTMSRGQLQKHGDGHWASRPNRHPASGSEHGASASFVHTWLLCSPTSSVAVCYPGN